MALSPEMRHPIPDGVRLAKDDGYGTHVGEGFLWFADRLLEGTDSGPKPNEALRFLRVAAELGVTGAFVRIGQMCESGVGTDRDSQLAQAAYARAAAGADAFDESWAVTEESADLARPHQPRRP
jgi:TPR repeat protein